MIIKLFCLIHVDNFHVGYYSLAAREVATSLYFLRFCSLLFSSLLESLQNLLEQILINFPILREKSFLHDIFPARCLRIILSSCRSALHHILTV